MGFTQSGIDFIRKRHAPWYRNLLYIRTGNWLLRWPSIYLSWVQGHDLLIAEGFPKHALVCERHTEQASPQKILLIFTVFYQTGDGACQPGWELIAYLYKFFSKDHGHLDEPLPYRVLERIRNTEMTRQKYSSNGTINSTIADIRFFDAEELLPLPYTFAIIVSV